MKKFLFLLLFVPFISHGAISFDAASSNETTGSTITFSHNQGTNDNDILVCTVNNQSATPTSVTYNGDAMTLIVSNSAGSSDLYTYALLNPDSGTNNVVVTNPASVETRTVCMSYLDVEQSLSFDDTDSGRNPGDNTSLTATVTTLVDDSWQLMWGGIQRDPSAGTGSTQRAEVGGALAGYDSGVIATAGSNAMTYTFAECSANCMTFTTIVIAPFEDPEVLGCTDPEALNYDPEATEDDDSCEYPAEIPVNEGGLMHFETYASILFAITCATVIYVTIRVFKFWFKRRY